MSPMPSQSARRVRHFSLSLVLIFDVRRFARSATKADKENVREDIPVSDSNGGTGGGGNDVATKMSVATPSPSKRLSALRMSSSAASPPGSANQTYHELRTPPGSSNILRQHFRQLSMSSSSPSAAAASSSHRRHRRLMDAGPVRILSPRGKMHAQLRRIETGVGSPASRDGSSSASATNVSGSDQSSLSIECYTLPAGGASAGDSPPHPHDRPCTDPVALTLLNGGLEDMAWLAEWDRSGWSSPAASAATPTRSTPKAVSADPSDVYGGEYYARGMARPVAVPARRRQMLLRRAPSATK